MEHAGENREQLSVGIMMEAYGGQAVSASNKIFCKSKEETSRKACDC